MPPRLRPVGDKQWRTQGGFPGHPLAGLEGTGNMIEALPSLSDGLQALSESLLAPLSRPSGLFRPFSWGPLTSGPSLTKTWVRH